MDKVDVALEVMKLTPNVSTEITEAAEKVLLDYLLPKPKEPFKPVRVTEASYYNNTSDPLKDSRSY